MIGAEDARRRNHLAVEHDGERACRHSRDVTSPKRWPPRMLNRKLTTGSPVRWSKPGCASVRSSPGHHHALLHRVSGRPVLSAAACRLRSAGRPDRRRGGTRAWPSCRGCSFSSVVSCRPGTSTRMRSAPCCWMFGSVVPSASTRRRSTSIDWSTARRILSLIAASVSVSCTEPSPDVGHVERMRRTCR